MIPPRYRPSLRLSDGLYEIFLYPDDPHWKDAEKCLEKRAPYALSNGRSFIGRPEDYAGFEAAVELKRQLAALAQTKPCAHTWALAYTGQAWECNECGATLWRRP